MDQGELGRRREKRGVGAPGGKRSGAPEKENENVRPEERKRRGAEEKKEGLAPQEEEKAGRRRKKRGSCAPRRGEGGAQEKKKEVHAPQLVEKSGKDGSGRAVKCVGAGRCAAAREL